MENIHTKVNCIIHSKFAHAWAELWRKAYSPQDFIDGIQSLEILQKTDDVIVRVMKINNSVVKERITKDEKSDTIKFHNLPDSDFQGNVYNHILKAQQGKQDKLELIFYSSATNKNGDNFPPKQIFQKALLKTKSVIEATSQI